MHWSDVAIKANNPSKCRLLKNFYSKLNPSASSEDLEEGQSAVADAYLLQYGPKTLAALQNAVRTSFKLFWDGSISIY